MQFDPFEVDEMLRNMKVIADTREQDTHAFRQRIRDIGCPVERRALSYGDYTAETTLPNGQVYSLSDKLVIERKMNLDELCACFGKGRQRFTKELERAKADGARVLLLVESGSWEKAYSGEYRSLYAPAALVASMMAWMERYGMIPQFCRPELTGKLIYGILRYALKERLEAGLADEQ